jgi:hypothetical protein
MTFFIFAPIFWGFSYTIVQVLGSAILGAILELFMEAIFSPIGYRLSRRWKLEGVGNEYIMYAMEKEAKKMAEVI